MQNHFHAVVGAVNHGARFNAGEGVTKVTKMLGKRFAGRGQLVGVVGLSGLHRHQGAEFFFTPQIITIQTDFGDRKLLALAHVDGDLNAFFIR